MLEIPTNSLSVKKVIYSKSITFFSISCYFICLRSLPLKRLNIHNDIFSFRPRDRIWNMNSVMWICSVMLHNKLILFNTRLFLRPVFCSSKLANSFTCLSWIHCDNRIYMVDILSYPQSILHIVLNLSSHKFDEGIKWNRANIYCIQWLGQIRCIKNNFEKSCFNLLFSMKNIYTQMKFI